MTTRLLTNFLTGSKKKRNPRSQLKRALALSGSILSKWPKFGKTKTVQTTTMVNLQRLLGLEAISGTSCFRKRSKRRLMNNSNSMARANERRSKFHTRWLSQKATAIQTVIAPIATKPPRRLKLLPRKNLMTWKKRTKSGILMLNQALKRNLSNQTKVLQWTGNQLDPYHHLPNLPSSLTWTSTHHANPRRREREYGCLHQTNLECLQHPLLCLTRVCQACQPQPQVFQLQQFLLCYLNTLPSLKSQHLFKQRLCRLLDQLQLCIPKQLRHPKLLPKFQPTLSLILILS